MVEELEGKRINITRDQSRWRKRRSYLEHPDEWERVLTLSLKEVWTDEEMREVYTFQELFFEDDFDSKVGMVLRYPDGSEEVFESQTAVARRLGIRVSEVNKYLVDNVSPTRGQAKDHWFRYIDDNREPPKPTVEQGISVTAKNLETGETLEFKSVSECSAYFHMTNSAMLWSLNKYEGYGHHKHNKGWFFEMEGK